MDHLKRVADEFTRQAQNFDHWAAKADDPSRFGAALGEARRGRLLDVACGPGVVTAALAPEASSVTAFDATEPMLEKAKARCTKAGFNNVAFRSGDAKTRSSTVWSRGWRSIISPIRSALLTKCSACCGPAAPR
jgi:ubiquinone/menaquinone biosynthesis C-methylase UbiE